MYLFYHQIGTVQLLLLLSYMLSLFCFDKTKRFVPLEKKHQLCCKVTLLLLKICCLCFVVLFLLSFLLLFNCGKYFDKHVVRTIRFLFFWFLFCCCFCRCCCCCCCCCSIGQSCCQKGCVVVGKRRSLKKWTRLATGQIQN